MKVYIFIVIHLVFDYQLKKSNNIIFFKEKKLKFCQRKKKRLLIVKQHSFYTVLCLHVCACVINSRHFLLLVEIHPLPREKNRYRLGWRLL